MLYTLEGLAATRAQAAVCHGHWPGMVCYSETMFTSEKVKEGSCSCALRGGAKDSTNEQVYYQYCPFTLYPAPFLWATMSSTLSKQIMENLFWEAGQQNFAVPKNKKDSLFLN